MTITRLTLFQSRRHVGRAVAGYAFLAFFSFAGCASSRMAPPESMPSSSAEGQQEIADLEQQIARGRVALGLGARENLGEQDRSPALRSAASAPRAAAPPAPAAPVMAPSAPASEGVMDTSSSDSPRQESDASEVQSKTSSEEQEVCPGPCRFTRAICQAAGRICRIAEYLGESDAHQRCQRAQQDCAEARSATLNSCPDC